VENVCFRATVVEGIICRYFTSRYM
jgi:hypothetical protein